MSEKIPCTLHEDRSTFMLKSIWKVLKLTEIQINLWRRLKYTFNVKKPFRKWRPLGDDYEKSGRATQVMDGRKQHDACRVIKTEITYCFRRDEILSLKCIFLYIIQAKVQWQLFFTWKFSTRLRVMAFPLLWASRWHSDTPHSLGTTDLDEWSARRKNLYLTIRNISKQQISMPPAEFEPAIQESERPKPHSFDRTATGIGF
jgi:hypothetical protein